MRKGITSSVFILLFAMVTGSVFAGDKSACEKFKNDKDNKGAYGLCVAYQNADEAGKADILSNWEKRFGTGPEAPVLPGTSNVSCPCWTEETANSMKDGLYAYSCENPDYSSYGEVIYGPTPDLGPFALVLMAGETWFSKEGGSDCAVFSDIRIEAFLPVSEAEAAACNAVISNLILAEAFIEDCMEPTE